MNANHTSLTGAAMLLVVAGAAALDQDSKPAALTSHVTVMTIHGASKQVIYAAPRLFEAPNWSPDGQYLLLNSDGKLWRLPLRGGEPERVPTGTVTGINNDHGFSPDGKQIAISVASGSPVSAGHICVLPAAGGEPRALTENAPSYFHSWSPDGKTLAYCAPRDGNFDIYAISASGGPERRLTTHAGYDDGPDYSPDGKWIYFNSDRSGSWDIWRMPADGARTDDADAERVTSDEYEDWFPHPSPDGRWLVFLSYMAGTRGHPAHQDVLLRLMPLPGQDLEDGPVRVLDRFRGGQGTINVPSWSPDGRRFAYVSYSLE